jgi:alcohol dehydrogenase
VSALCRDLRVPDGLAAFHPDVASIPGLARGAADSGYNKWNPRYTTYEDFVDLLEQLYAR